MKRIARASGIALGIVVLLLLAVSLFVDANRFRPMLESRLSAALAREVHVGDLKLSLISGGVAASNLTIADDPAYRRDTFLSAKSLRVGVEIWARNGRRRLRHPPIPPPQADSSSP